ncbi:MAG: phosphotransferase [Lachnospiraceae bacterium]|nr:phosphotransferase [Lachnospiraceae bacterium]
MDDKEIKLPAELRPYLGSAALENVSGHSMASTFKAGTGYYIKTDEAGSLAREYELAQLFHRLGLGPEAPEYLSADRDWLVTRKAVGEDLTRCLNDPGKLCEILAGALKKLHSLPAEGLPVSSRYERFMESSDGSPEGGSWDGSVLTDRWPIGSKQEAWEIMQKNRHLLKCDTFIHGDACLPNILQKNGAFSSFIDTAMAGAGDRHIDLYWAVWSLNYNLKTDTYTDLFLDLYGREHFSEEAMRTVAAFEVFG